MVVPVVVFRDESRFALPAHRNNVSPRSVPPVDARRSFLVAHNEPVSTVARIDKLTVALS